MLLQLVVGIAKTLRPFDLAERFVNCVCRGEKFFGIDQIYNPFFAHVSKRLVLELPGRGCAWFKKSGGCTMCGFNQKLEAINQRWNLSASDLTGLYKIAELLTRAEKPELLCIFNGGSFLNEEEIPLKTQLAIVKAVGLHSTFKILFVESRPEFVIDKRISSLLDALKQKKLEVGVGLEAVTDKVREVCIHKGFGLPAFEKAVRTLKKYGIYVLTYVFLKPLGLSEKEAIEEAVRTIEYAFETGSDEVSLSCAFIQKGTPMARAYEQGEFRPPWLWSIIEAVRRTAHFGPVRIGSFKDNPLPIAIPRNCPKCSQRVEKTLQEYNFTRNIAVFDNLCCDCQKQWSREIKKA